MSGLSSLPFRPRLLCVTGLPLTLLGGLAVGVGVLFAATYAVVGSYALSIIILSVGITLLATPLTALAWKSQSARARLLPEIEDLRRRHHDDRQLLAAETAALFKRHHVSPWSGVLPLLPPALVYLALYQVLRGLIHRPAGSASLLPRYISHSTRLYHALAHGTTMRAWGVDLARNGAAALQIPLLPPESSWPWSRSPSSPGCGNDI
jgi:hypothetical protein